MRGLVFGPVYGRSASPFIEEGDGFYKGEGFRMRTLLSLVAHVYPAWFFILDECEGR